MASGKKNYFRHSTTAFEDEKIQMCIELLGVEGYAYYFILIELLARQCENEFKNPIRIHPQSLRIVWRKHHKSCNKVLEKLQQSGLFVVTFNKSFYEFDIPNLAKYMGKYQTKNSPNTPNKKKVKEKKVKEKKTNSVSDFDLDLIYAEYPKKVGKKKGVNKLQSLVKTQEMYDKILQGAIDYKKYTTEQGIPRQYIKGFEPWVNGRCWEDELVTDSQVKEAALAESDEWFKNF